MFYTPGWGAIVGVGGTVAGVTVTHPANYALSWRTSRIAELNSEKGLGVTATRSSTIAAGATAGTREGGTTQVPAKSAHADAGQVIGMSPG